MENYGYTIQAKINCIKKLWMTFHIDVLLHCKQYNNNQKHTML